MEKLGKAANERVPERIVHAKGTSAHGFFNVTNPKISAYTKADFLSDVGKITPIIARFSTVAGELGSADTLRDNRGLAIKFYTDDGNYDLTALSVPVFPIADPMKFSYLIHA